MTVPATRHPRRLALLGLLAGGLVAGAPLHAEPNDHDLARQALQEADAEAQARYARIDEVLERGLEAWLQDAMARLIRLGEAIQREFMVSTDVATPVVAPVRPWGADQQ